TKIADVVRPTSIIVHKDKNHYGSKREGDIESIYKTLEAGELHAFKEISIAKADFLSFAPVMIFIFMHDDRSRADNICDFS
ncbi:hypothetical protein ACT453_56435, partial [Bacillus sp. D-CC]